jgi:hypothetical protein
MSIQDQFPRRISRAVPVAATRRTALRLWREGT